MFGAGEGEWWAVEAMGALSGVGLGVGQGNHGCVRLLGSVNPLGEG